MASVLCIANEVNCTILNIFVFQYTEFAGKLFRCVVSNVSSGQRGSIILPLWPLLQETANRQYYIIPPPWLWHLDLLELSSPTIVRNRRSIFNSYLCNEKLCVHAQITVGLNAQAFVEYTYYTVINCDQNMKTLLGVAFTCAN